MIDLARIQIIPAADGHYDFAYRVKKIAYGPAITRLWGWEEDKQQEFFAQDWAKQPPDIICDAKEPIGTICFYQKEGPLFAGRYFIEHFYILPEYQNQGVGAHVLKHYLAVADAAGLPVNLMVLSFNPAASLYTRHGFKVIEAKEPFLLMERLPPVNQDKTA